MKGKTLGALDINISSPLQPDAILESLSSVVREFASYQPFRSGLEGNLEQYNLTIAYKTGWHCPPVRIATFRGKVLAASNGSVLRGTLSPNWIVYAYAATVPAFIVSWIIRFAISDEYPKLLLSIASVGGVLLAGRAYVRTARSFVVSELCRATNGKQTS